MDLNVSYAVRKVAQRTAEHRVRVRVFVASPACALGSPTLLPLLMVSASCWLYGMVCNTQQSRTSLLAGTSVWHRCLTWMLCLSGVCFGGGGSFGCNSFWWRGLL